MPRYHIRDEGTFPVPLYLDEQQNAMDIKYPDIDCPGEVYDCTYFPDPHPEIDTLVILEWWDDVKMPILIWKTPKIHRTRKINSIINALMNHDPFVPDTIIDIIIDYAVVFKGPPFNWVKILKFEGIAGIVTNWTKLSKTLEYFPNIEKLCIHICPSFYEKGHKNTLDDFYQFIKTMYNYDKLRVIIIFDTKSPFISQLTHEALFECMSINSTLFIGSENVPQYDSFNVTTQKGKHIISRKVTSAELCHSQYDSMLNFIDNLYNRIVLLINLLDS